MTFHTGTFLSAGTGGHFYPLEPGDISIRWNRGTFLSVLDTTLPFSLDGIPGEAYLYTVPFGTAAS
jgi:hypothetical protein